MPAAPLPPEYDGRRFPESLLEACADLDLCCEGCGCYLEEGERGYCRPCVSRMPPGHPFLWLESLE